MERLLRIDLIVPAFNARKTLFRALCSVAAQSVAGEVDVIVVDDASTEGDLADIVRRFEGALSVRLLRLPENVGPGFARQRGIGYTGNPLVAFLDADDTMGGAMSLWSLRESLLTEGHEMASGEILIVRPDGTLPGGKSSARFAGSVCGKLYRRSFLNAFDIRFLSSRANEDAGFNMLASLCAGDRDWQARIGETVYCAFFRPDSLTHGGEHIFLYEEGFAGYVDNRIRVLGAALQRGVSAASVRRLAVRSMYTLYAFYSQCRARKPALAEKNLALCRHYWREAFVPAKDMLPQEEHARLFTQAMREEYGVGWMTGVLPELSLQGFLDALGQNGPG